MPFGHSHSWADVPQAPSISGRKRGQQHASQAVRGRLPLLSARGLFKGKNTKAVKGVEGMRLSHSAEFLLLLQAMNNSHSDRRGSDWNSSRERKNYLQNNRLWSKSEEAGREVAGGSCPELTEEFSQVLAIYNPPAN